MAWLILKLGSWIAELGQASEDKTGELVAQEKKTSTLFVLKVFMWLPRRELSCHRQSSRRHFLDSVMKMK